MSDFVPVTLDYPCALNLTLVPSSTGFTFVPFNIELGVGEIYEDFRISVPASTDDNEYIINWTILGERNPLFYTPISKPIWGVCMLTHWKYLLCIAIPQLRICLAAPLYSLQALPAWA